MRAKGMGANVMVCEVDPLRALEAVMDGYQVLPLREAAKRGDIFVTVSGDTSVIRKEHFLLMKDGVILANSGHFNVEIDIPALEKLAKRKRRMREFVEEYTLKSNRRLFLLGEGRLINLVAAEGHPPSVMDMSFANQALVSEFVKKEARSLEKRVYGVPRTIDEKIAQLKLRSLGYRIDILTPEQKRYLSAWELGT